MTTKPGSLSEKIPRREKIISLFAIDDTAGLAAGLATEVKAHLFALSLVILGMEAFLLYGGAPVGNVRAFPRSSFVFIAMLFFFFFTLLEYIFRPFTGRRAAALIPMLPAALLFFLFRNAGSRTHLFDNTSDAAPALFGNSSVTGPASSTGIWPILTAAVATATVIRLFLALVPRRERFLLYGVIIPDAAAAWLYFAGNASPNNFAGQVLSGRFPTDKLLWIALVILTLSALQALVFERNGTTFPFSFFAFLGVFLLLFPMSPNPIDWTPVVRTGERAVRFVADAADGASYYLSSFFDDGSYTAGYSSLDMNGGRISRSETTQLLLKTDESPYYLFKDVTSSQNMKMRRTVYLAGGRGVDKQQLVTFLRFLQDCGVDRDYAALFSQISKLDVEYAYLNTPDEIVPASSLLITAGNETIESGVSTSGHKKGYTISATYLDIDYGSPYLTALLRKVTEIKSSGAEVVSSEAVSSNEADFSYETAREYMESLYDMDLSTLLTKEEFEAAAGSLTSYTATEGASDRLTELAADLTEGADNEYDKCKLIETHLRQYTYDTNAVGGHDPKSDLSTPEGMSDIADRFLFETGTGYCVHFTASMVTLLRLAGIPARVVSGYRYVFPFEQGEAYTVSGNCAHVWPEAYLTGIGWVPFEPTAAYGTAAEFTWHRMADAVTAGKYGVFPAQSERSENSSGKEEPFAGDHDSNRPVTENQDLQDPATGNLPFRIFQIVWPVFLSILILLITLIAGTDAISKYRYRRGTPEQKLLMDVEVIKKRIRRLYGNEFTDRGLLTDYADVAPEALKSDMQRVIRAYYRIVYGGAGASGVTAEESALARALREKLQRVKPDSLKQHTL